MKCSDRKIGRNLTEYLERKLTGALRREFEVHLFECPYCWGKVQQAEKDEEIDTLLRTYGREALLEAKEKLKHKKQLDITISLLKNNKPVLKIPLAPPDYSWSIGLPGPGIYHLKYKGKPIGWYKEIHPKLHQRGFLADDLPITYRSQAKVFKLASGKGDKTIDLIVSLRQERGKVFLSIERKKSIWNLKRLQPNS